MSDHEPKKLPAFLKTVYLSNREIRLILAGLYSLNMPPDEIEATLWKKLLFEKLHKKTRRKKKQMTNIARDSLKLKAAIEFGSEYTYTIKNGGLGPTLLVKAPSKKMAGIIRKKIPGTWEGLYVMVIYINNPDFDDNSLLAFC